MRSGSRRNGKGVQNFVAKSKRTENSGYVSIVVKYYARGWAMRDEGFLRHF